MPDRETSRGRGRPSNSDWPGFKARRQARSGTAAIGLSTSTPALDTDESAGSGRDLSLVTDRCRPPAGRRH